MNVYLPVYETNEMTVTSSKVYKNLEDAVRELNNRKYHKQKEDDTHYTRRDKGVFRPYATAYIDDLTLS